MILFTVFWYLKPEGEKSENLDLINIEIKKQVDQEMIILNYYNFLVPFYAMLIHFTMLPWGGPGSENLQGDVI